MSTGQSNVVLFPQRATDRKLRGPSDAVRHLRQKFVGGERQQRETFVHLARHMHRLIEELKDSFGQRSGKLNEIFGDKLKNKRRYALAPDAAPGFICNNPATWMTLLKDFAKAVGADEDKVFLEAMRGSPLLPDGNGLTLQRPVWLANFRELIERMTEVLNAEAGLAAIHAYLADAGLVVEDGRLVVCENGGDGDGYEDDSQYSPVVLAELPHVFGLNFRSMFKDLDLDLVREKVTFEEPELEGIASATLWANNRIGLALVPDTQGRATIAFVDWYVRKLEFSDGQRSWSMQTHLSDADLGLEGDPSDLRVPNSVRFSFLGTDAFDSVAAMRILLPEVYHDDHALFKLDWASIRSSSNQTEQDGQSTAESIDGPRAPYLETDDTLGEEQPTESPSRTVAAVVERNLLYTPRERAAHRIDNMLAQQLKQLQALVAEHRLATADTVAAARRALLDQWSEKAGKERNDEQ